MKNKNRSLKESIQANRFLINSKIQNVRWNNVILSEPLNIKKKHCSIKLIDYMTKIHHNSQLGNRTAIDKNSP